MRSRWLLGLFAAVMLSFSASCGQGKEVVAGLKKLQKKACECEDKKCAEKVMDEFVQFATDHKEARGSDEHVKEAGKVTEKTFKCLTEAGLSPSKVMDAAKDLKKLQ